MAVGVFLDKDGTLVNEVPYNVDPRLLRLSLGALPGTAAMQRAGFRLVVVSNQSGISRGYFSSGDVDALNAALAERLAEAGVRIDAFYYCPHRPEDGCGCRKPRPGLLQRAADELELELSGSWMVGDILDDVEAGHRAGCRSILVASGGETEWRAGELRVPETIVPDLETAARYILGQQRVHPSLGALPPKRSQEPRAERYA